MNMIDMFQNLSSNNSNNNPIPKEVIEQYPYGEFPLRYTKSGQEIIRKQSESRFKYDNPVATQNVSPDNKSENLNLSMLLPLIQMMSGSKKNPKDMMQIFSKLLFKDNPDMQKLFSMLPNIKGQEITPQNEFPDTNKVSISSLKKID